jgi:hypothetical protein
MTLMKTAILAAVLILALVTHLVAHVATVVHIGKHRSWTRAVLAFVRPPLAPLWAWKLGNAKRLVHAWLGSLAAYAIGVGVSNWLANR